MRSLSRPSAEWERAVARSTGQGQDQGLLLPLLVGELKNKYVKEDYPSRPHFASGVNIRDTVEGVLGRNYIFIKRDTSHNVINPADVVPVVTKIQEMLHNVTVRLEGARALHAVMLREMAQEAAAREAREAALWAGIEPIVRERSEVGRGNSCFVYKGVLDGQAVACKTLRPGAKAAAKQFVNEVTLMGQLRHPHILPCLQSLRRGEGEFYVVLPLAEAGSLERPKAAAVELLKSGRERLRVAQCVAEVRPHRHASVRAL